IFQRKTPRPVAWTLPAEAQTTEGVASMIATSIALDTLQATIARALAQSPAARGRIERAAVLIGLGAVEKLDETTYRVASQTGSGESYTVTPGGCTCIDAERHPGQRCKHQWAVRIPLSA